MHVTTTIFRCRSARGYNVKRILLSCKHCRLLSMHYESHMWPGQAVPCWRMWLMVSSLEVFMLNHVRLISDSVDSPVFMFCGVCCFINKSNQLLAQRRTHESNDWWQIQTSCEWRRSRVTLSLLRSLHCVCLCRRPKDSSGR